MGGGLQVSIPLYKSGHARSGQRGVPRMGLDASVSIPQDRLAQFRLHGDLYHERYLRVQVSIPHTDQESTFGPALRDGTSLRNVSIP